MPTQTVFFIILAAIIAAGLALVQYYFGKRQPSWILFSALRFITYFAVFLLLINPKFRQESFSIQKPSLVVAVDNSSSIKEFEQGEAVRDFVKKLKANKKLKDRFSIETYTFGNNFEKSDSLNFLESQTNISEAFSNLDKLYKNQTAPTLLITDGNQTYGQDYEFRAKNYAQPLYPVVVGDTMRYVDLKINRLNVNRYAFLNNKFPVEVFVNYNGQKTISQTFTITQGGRTLFSKTLKFDGDKTSAIVKANLPAESVGVRTYEAKIAPLSDEKNTVNNSQKFAVEVIDQKTNVLLLTTFPHPDLGSLKKAIEHNQQRQATIKKTDDDIDFGKYQLVVLYQPNSKFKRAFEQIKQLNLNTLTITGTDTDYQFLNRNQDFFKKEITGQTEDFLPAYNPNYSSFQFEDIGFDDFPPLEDKFGELTFNTKHQTLLFQTVQGIQSKTPLLATVEQNKRRFGFLFGENSWEWRAKSFRDTDSFETYDEFIGKLVQYLASNKRKERLSADFKSFYNSGETIILRAHYFDENYQFDPRAKLLAKVVNQKTKETQTFPFLLKNNHYAVDLSNLKPDNYDFTVNVKGEKLAKSGKFTIVDFDVEKQFLNANADKLKKISSKPLNFLNTENSLIKELLNNENYKPVQKSKTKTSPLVDWWYLLVIIVLSLSVEWFLRKYKGLI